LGGGALTMALAQEAEPWDHFREFWLAHKRLCMSEARSINRAEILTARADAAAKAAEVSAAEAAAIVHIRSSHGVYICASCAAT
jgi:hypothetical protein